MEVLQFEASSLDHCPLQQEEPGSDRGPASGEETVDLVG